MIDLKKVAQKSGLAPKAGPDPVRVLVALRAAPDDAVLARLQGLGLEVERTIERTVIGRIAGDRLDALDKDPAVEKVERSTPLRYTAPE
jgi:hypothetical protein